MQTSKSDFMREKLTNFRAYLLEKGGDSETIGVLSLDSMHSTAAPVESTYREDNILPAEDADTPPPKLQEPRLQDERNWYAEVTGSAVKEPVIHGLNALSTLQETPERK